MADPPNLTLIGGEMPAFADRPVGGPLLRWLVTAACPPGGRVLVAGPHEAGLVESLAAGRAVTCLQRSHVDAVALAERCPEVRVLCGSLAKLGADERFDAVVALAGLPRVLSTEEAQLGWAQALNVLVSALDPRGRLLLAVDNPLGVHELVSLPGAEINAAWPPAAEDDPTHPRSPDTLTDRLTAAGLRAGPIYAGYPLPDAPTLLIPPATAPEAPGGQPDGEPGGPGGGVFAGLVAAACGGGFAGTPVLTDPRRLATSALRAGLTSPLAPLWLVAAHRTQDHRSDLGNLWPLEGQQRSTIAVAGPRAGVEGAVYEIAADGTRRLLEAPAAPATTARVRHDPSRLTGPAPRGRTLEELAIGACRRHDRPELRRLLGAYATWLSAQCDDAGNLPGDHAFATPENTVLDGTTFTILDPSHTLTAPVPPEVALARGLRQLAVALLTGGHRHPWPAGIDADALTVVLAGAAGRTLSRTTIGQAVDLELEITRNAAVTTVDAATPPVDLDSHRALHRSVARLREELAHARAKADWYAELLDSRERSLERARDKLDLLSGSLSYRLGRVLLHPARTLVRLVRR